MAKQKQRPESHHTLRPMTKRQISKWERERRVNRALIICGAVFLALVLAIPAFGYYQDEIAQGNSLIARVNGRTFDMNYYLKLLRFRDFQLAQQASFLQSLAGQGQGSNAAQLAQSQLQYLQNQRAILPMQVIEEVVDNELIRAGAAKAGLAVTPSNIDDAIRKQFQPPADQGQEQVDEAKRQAEFDTNFKETLRLTNFSEPEFRSLIVEAGVLREKLSQQLQSQVPTSGEQVHLYGIMVDEEAAAKDVLAKLEAGQDFSALAAEVSKDSFKDQGGEMGWFPRGVLTPEMDDAAFKLQPGQVSQIVNVSGNYYILKVAEREANRPIAEDRLSPLRNGALGQWLKAQKNDQSNQIERYFDSDKQIWAMKRTNKAAAAWLGPSTNR